MSNLLSLPIATPEQLKSMSPFSGTSLVNAIKKSPNEKLVLLDTNARFQDGNYPKLAFVFSFNNRQYLVRMDAILETSKTLQANQQFTPDIREFEDKDTGRTINYVVAVQ